MKRTKTKMPPVYRRIIYDLAADNGEFATVTAKKTLIVRPLKTILKRHKKGLGR